MLVALNGESLEAALPDVPAAAVVAVVSPHVTGEKPLHPAPQIAVAARPKHEMKMIRHQAPADQPHRQPFAGRLEQPHERREILVFVEHLAAGIATIQDVVAPIRSAGSGGPRHQRSLPPRPFPVKKK
jgi:hypothetical protein